MKWLKLSLLVECFKFSTINWLCSFQVMEKCVWISLITFIQCILLYNRRVDYSWFTLKIQSHCKLTRRCDQQHLIVSKIRTIYYMVCILCIWFYIEKRLIINTTIYKNNRDTLWIKPICPGGEYVSSSLQFMRDIES